MTIQHSLDNLVKDKSPSEAAEILALCYVKLQNDLLTATDRNTLADAAIELRRVIRYAKQHNINRYMMNHVALLTKFMG